MKDSFSISNKYDDIISLPHYQSKTRKKMKITDRAAQFSPFAALPGYEGTLVETARLTTEMPELDDNQKSDINEQLMLIVENLEKNPTVVLSYFEYDERKTGGSVIKKSETIKKISVNERYILFKDKTRISIDNILSIDLVDY